MTATEKVPPPSTGNTIHPPPADYEYFQNAPEHPFHPRATTFEPVHAGWLAEAALLAYADPRFVTERFRAAGRSTVEHFRVDDTEGFIAHNEEFALVAFRGTAIDPLRNILIDRGGHLHDDPNLASELVEPFERALAPMFSTFDWLRRAIISLFPDYLAHSAPIYYGVRMWNNSVPSLK